MEDSDLLKEKISLEDKELIIKENLYVSFD